MPSCSISTTILHNHNHSLRSLGTRSVWQDIEGTIQGQPTGGRVTGPWLEMRSRNGRICKVGLPSLSATPLQMYICLDSEDSYTQFNHHGDTDDSGVSWESESENLEEALQRFNKNVETFPPLTDFSSGSTDFMLCSECLGSG